MADSPNEAAGPLSTPASVNRGFGISLGSARKDLRGECRVSSRDIRIARAAPQGTYGCVYPSTVRHLKIEVGCQAVGRALVGLEPPVKTDCHVRPGGLASIAVAMHCARAASTSPRSCRAAASERTRAR